METKRKTANGELKLYLLYNSPQTKSNIFSVTEKEKRRKQEVKKKDPISLPLFFSLFFSPLSLSLLPSTPSCSVFRLSSLREWSTIKDLIKTPEQAKALWQYARPGPARPGQAGRQAGRLRLLFGPRAGLCAGVGGWGR